MDTFWSDGEIIQSPLPEGCFLSLSILGLNEENFPGDSASFTREYHTNHHLKEAVNVHIRASLERRPKTWRPHLRDLLQVSEGPSGPLGPAPRAAPALHMYVHVRVYTHVL